MELHEALAALIFGLVAGNNRRTIRVCLINEILEKKSKMGLSGADAGVCRVAIRPAGAHESAGENGFCGDAEPAGEDCGHVPRGVLRLPLEPDALAVV